MLLNKFVAKYIADIAPFLVVGQEIEFTLNLEMDVLRDDKTCEFYPVNSNKETGNKIRFKVKYTHELKKYIKHTYF